MAATQARERYCKLCGKTVMGLDHHCVWLNTCVGKRTYWAFFILATAGAWLPPACSCHAMHAPA